MVDVRDIPFEVSLADVPTVPANGNGVPRVRLEEIPSRFTPLDLTQDPPKPNWLVDGLIAIGDVTMLESAEGSYKSWVTMGLAVAIANGAKTFLGRSLSRSGAVLYADEENPEDVIRSRLLRLGLTTEGAARLCYLSNQSVELDTSPEEFLEYAKEIRPELVVLDSLTRFHNQDENAAGPMARLFNRGIQPLARMGSSVVLIHHQNATGGVRGSTDIKASIDARLTVSGVSPNGSFQIRQSKTRRSRLNTDGFWVRLRDNPDGSIDLCADTVAEPRF